jgi:hypothetical protein
MLQTQPSRARMLVAWVMVVLTVLAAWKFIDYRNQPPQVSSVAAPV